MVGPRVCCNRHRPCETAIYRVLYKLHNFIVPRFGTRGLRTRIRYISTAYDKFVVESHSINMSDGFDYSLGFTPPQHSRFSKILRAYTYNYRNGNRWEESRMALRVLVEKKKKRNIIKAIRDNNEMRLVYGGPCETCAGGARVREKSLRENTIIIIVRVWMYKLKIKTFFFFFDSDRTEKPGVVRFVLPSYVRYLRCSLGTKNRNDVTSRGAVGIGGNANFSGSKFSHSNNNSN